MKILKASCLGGQVIADGMIVSGCEIMGEGGASDGWLVLGEGEAVYFPKTTPDLKDTLDFLTDILQEMIAGIKNSNTGGKIVEDNFKQNLTLLIAKIEAFKEVLK